MKNLLVALLSGIIGIAIGMFVCNHTYSPQLTALKEQVGSLTTELEQSKKSTHLVFGHNENCKINVE